MTTQACLFAVLAAPTLSRCLLLVVLVNFFFLAAKEGFHSPCVGGCPSACGWPCFSKILGKDVVNPSITSQSCFNTQCLFCIQGFNIIVLLVNRCRPVSLYVVGARLWQLPGSL